MTLSFSDLDSLHDMAVLVSQRAGCLIQSRIDNHSGVQKKAGGDSLASQLVTEVDHESQALILDELAGSTRRFDFGLLAEEMEDDSSRLEKAAFWCIDPIDGTLPFTEGVPGYSVSIALVSRDGFPLIGVIHDPVDRITYHAFRGGGAFQNGRLIPTPSEVEDGQLSWCMDRSMKQMVDFDSVRAVIEVRASEFGFDSIKLFEGAGSVLNACWVTSKAPAIYFKFPKPSKGGGSVWDFAATACLLDEWGRPPTDIHGAPIDLNPGGSTFMNEKGVVYASSLDLQEFICGMYRELKRD